MGSKISKSYNECSSIPNNIIKLISPIPDSTDPIKEYLDNLANFVFVQFNTPHIICHYEKRAIIAITVKSVELFTYHNDVLFHGSYNFYNWLLIKHLKITPTEFQKVLFNTITIPTCFELPNANTNEITRRININMHGLRSNFICDINLAYNTGITIKYDAYCMKVLSDKFSIQQRVVITH